ncbi:MAG: EAL domain-containing protein [Burkholderiales bacterium]|nr:EAL domain-containing protein [Burkholderiales bacterium]
MPVSKTPSLHHLRPLWAAAVVFLLSLFVSAVVIQRMEADRIEDARTALREITNDRAVDVEQALDRALSAVYGLAALVQQGHGTVKDFDAVAAKMLPYYPGVSILILAPNGVISHAVPKAGNEKAIGLDLLQDPVMRNEAQLARNTSKLTLAGPLELRQGGMGLVARLPIFLEDARNTPVFWGFTNVVLRFPQAVESAQLPGLAQRGLEYRLWRVNPQDGQIQTIAESGPGDLQQPVEKSFAVPNGNWTLSVAPRAGWDDPAGLVLKAGIALVLSLLLAYLAKLQMRSFAHKALLEQEVVARTAEIRASEHQLTATLDAIPDMLFEVDQNGLCLTSHAPRGSSLEAPVLDLLGQTVDLALPPAAAQTVHAALREAQAQGISNGKQLKLTLADGLRWFELSVARKPVAEGMVPRFILVSRDITARKNAELALQQSESYARAIVQTSPACVKLVAPDGTLLAMNPAGLVMVEADSADQVLGHSVFDLMAPEHREAFVDFNQRVCAGETCTLEFEIIGLKGGRRWLQSRAAPFSTQPDSPWVHLAITYDITESKLAQKKLQLAASVFTHAREGIMITDADGTIVEINDTFSQITGYSGDEAVGQNPRILKSGRQPSEFYAVLWSTLARTGSWAGEVWNRRKNGELYAQMLTISAVCDADGKALHYVSLFSDITPMKEHQRQLEHVAHYDVLTNLPNRLLLADRLKQAMRHAQRHKNTLAVAYLDLDGFKAVNDHHGRNIGDDLLAILAQRMHDALRDGDTLARIGGDEFVAVLSDLAHPHDIEPLLVRLLQAASSRVPVATAAGPAELQVSASAGVTLYPQDDVDADLLLRHADQAMYLAKQSGKNRFHLFDVAQDTAVKTRNESLDHVRRALEHNEFLLYYQPKVQMRIGAVVGMEALIRWLHPERGLLAPAAFLSVVEDDAISIEVGEWVIRTAVAQMQAWRTSGLNLAVSVNIGARQLQSDGFANRLKALLAEFPDVPAPGLQLEVLETSSLQDLGNVGTVMNTCCSMGVSFALDDFGTGYSSLTYLKHLPARTLKIDQSFVRDMLDDPSDLAIVNGVIGLARAFDREVLAEGVETRAHGQLLQSIGCEVAQGYGIARPMPAAQVPAWVAQWRTEARWLA